MPSLTIFGQREGDTDTLFSKHKLSFLRLSKTSPTLFLFHPSFVACATLSDGEDERKKWASFHSPRFFASFFRSVIPIILESGRGYYAWLRRTQTSLSLNLRTKKGGKEKTGETVHLTFLPFPWSFAFRHQSLAFRARLYAKNEALKEEAGTIVCGHLQKKKG